MNTLVTKLAEQLAVAAERAVFNGDNSCYDGGRVQFIEDTYQTLVVLPDELKGPQTKSFLVKYKDGAYGPSALPQISYR